MNYLQGPEAERKLREVLKNVGYRETRGGIAPCEFRSQMPYVGVFGETTTMDVTFRTADGRLVWVSSKSQKVSGSCDEKFYFAVHQFLKLDQIENAILCLSGPYFDPYYDVQWCSKRQGYKPKTSKTYERAEKRVAFLRDFLDRHSVDGKRFIFSFGREFESAVVENFGAGIYL